MARPATTPPPAPGPRAFVLDDSSAQGAELFTIEELSGDTVAVRCAYLFDIGEELKLRIEKGNDRFEAKARVIRVIEYRPQYLMELELFAVGATTRVVAG